MGVPSLYIVSAIKAFTTGGSEYRPWVTPIIPCDTEKESELLGLAVWDAVFEFRLNKSELEFSCPPVI
jgi:hypothetical protein